MKKAVVLTTVNVANNVSVIAERCHGWTPVVVGDLKTPHDENRALCAKHAGVYLSPTDQEKLGFTHSAALGWNTYGRKNIGYLFALKEGAEFIWSTDDDNVPVEDWQAQVEGLFTVGRAVSASPKDGGCYNNMTSALDDKGFEYPLLRPRGFPLTAFCGGSPSAAPFQDNVRPIGVVQGAILGDPDLYACDRLARVEPVKVAGYRAWGLNVPGHVLAPGLFCPTDTQNTFFLRETLPFHMLWAQPWNGTTGWERWDDIMAGYIGQTLCWRHGYVVKHGLPYARQDRNEHDVLFDLARELGGMRAINRVVETLIKYLWFDEHDGPPRAVSLTPLGDFGGLVDYVLDVGLGQPVWASQTRQLAQTWVDDLRGLGFE